MSRGRERNGLESAQARSLHLVLERHLWQPARDTCAHEPRLEVLPDFPPYIGHESLGTLQFFDRPVDTLGVAWLTSHLLVEAPMHRAHHRFEVRALVTSADYRHQSAIVRDPEVE